MTVAPKRSEYRRLLRNFQTTTRLIPTATFSLITTSSLAHAAWVESFCKDKGINLDGSTTVRDFVSLTKNSYGSETIRMLPQAYGVDEQNE